jgi:hypothetical protein
LTLNRKTLLVLAVLALLTGLVLWLSRGSESENRTSSLVEASDEEDVHAAAPDPVAPPPRKRELPLPPSRATSQRLHDDGVVGPHPDDPHLPGMKPHPLTPEHERIDAENALIQRLNDAMSFRKVREMREMLVEYRKLDPTDADANQAGYEVIADCIEFPGDASLTAARQFYDTERHSPLRRFVRRICFENSN